MLIETTVKVGSDSCIQALVIAFDDVDSPGHGQGVRGDSKHEASNYFTTAGSTPHASILCCTVTLVWARISSDVFRLSSRHYHKPGA